MLSLRLRPRAREDLVEIWRYSLGRWGRRRARLYMVQIRTQFDRICEASTAHRATDIREGYFIRRAGRHLIFYRKTESAVDVVRILHVAMDPDRHLGDEL